MLEMSASTNSRPEGSSSIMVCLLENSGRRGPACPTCVMMQHVCWTNGVGLAVAVGHTCLLVSAGRAGRDT
jgi:hypothetical protein